MSDVRGTVMVCVVAQVVRGAWGLLLCFGGGVEGGRLGLGMCAG